MHCYGEANREEPVPSKDPTPSDDGLLMGKLVHLALPVRWSLIEQGGRSPIEVACTYDIHPRGARLVSGREVNVGDLVVVERGRNKAVCQVVWRGHGATNCARWKSGTSRW
jgi:hypothetical protein